MTRFVVLFVSLAFLWTAEKADAQSAAETPATLASSWTLVSIERALSSEKAERAQQPRGLLIFDSAGHAFEWFTVASRQLPDAPLTDPVRTLATYGGFWGDYRVDAAQKRLVFSARGAISPSITAREFSRAFERAGDRLTLTTIDEPHAQGGTRWVWQRVPTVDNLSPLYRQVVGFWEYVVEKRVTAAGEVLSEQKRGGPSVIVYTPGGFVGVHFLPINTKPSPFAADVPTVEEARAALQGYVGYFGALTVYPGQIFHNVLSGINPGPGTVLRRFAEFSKDGKEINVKFPPAADQQGRMVTTLVTLRRLSGEAEMLGKR
jgi:hypothetical protein